MNYSKWDRFVSEMSDDEEQPQGNRPRVTTLPKAAPVTIGPDGSITVGGPNAEPRRYVPESSLPPSQRPKRLENKVSSAAPAEKKRGGAADPFNYSKWDKIDVSDSDASDIDIEMDARRERDMRLKAEKEAATAAAATAGAKDAASAKQPKAPAPTPIETLSADGNATKEFMWSQDRRQVVLSIIVPAGTSGKQLNVSLENRVVRVVVDGSDHLRKKMQYDVEPEEDLDWELVDFDGDDQRRRLVKLTMNKKQPVKGLVVWWSRCFEGDDPIDTTKLKGRKTTAKQHADMKKLWQAAHGQLFQNNKEREKIVVDIGR